MKNQFGGPWTEKKIVIFIKYLKAYLQIMNRQSFKLIYFDGFAGSGEIAQNPNYPSLIEGVATKVISIDKPRSFDIYYLVELDKGNANKLGQIIKQKFPQKSDKVIVSNEDCNKKLLGLSKFLLEHKNYRAIVFIDPKGMQLEWNSLLSFKKMGVDMWILVPTGIGINRNLNNSGKISNYSMNRLKKNLGLNEEEIKKSFYREEKDLTLFGDENITIKESKAIEKAAKLYQERLKTIFAHVSNPFPMKNSTGSIMYHFIFASNNKTGLKIANDIIGKGI